MADEPLVTYELDGDVALVGLNRDEFRNAINTELMNQLHAQVLRANEEARAGVIFSHGEKHFSAGLDLAEALSRRGQQDEGRPRRRRSNWHTTFDAISRSEIPWVAALKGATIGGGLELACATHVRVADTTTFFALPEGQRGIFVGGGGSVNIQRHLGYARMADLMLTGRVLTAEEGERYNLVQYVVPEGESFAKAKELAAKIASNAPLTNWAIVSILPRIGEAPHDDGLLMETLIGPAIRSNEGAQHLEQFLKGQAAPLKEGTGGTPHPDHASG
jgi:(methylthio)acryloyl-CoA hydratase